MKQKHQEMKQKLRFTELIAEYERSAAMAEERRQTLRAELKELILHKSGTAESAQYQNLLERRIELLRTEYLDMMEAIAAMRPYAEMEADGCGTK